MSGLAFRLKELRKSRKISQKILAGELGVAQTTIANYEQGTRFPDERVLHMLADYFGVTMDYLLGRNDVINVSRDSQLTAGVNYEYSKEDMKFLARHYMELVLSGDKQTANSLIMNEIKKGIKIEDLYLHVFEHALKQIGALWESGQLDVASEHYFSNFTITVMNQLYSYLNNQTRYPYNVILVSVNGELHNIGLRMVSDLLEMAGFKTYFLGSNLPTQSIIKTLEEKHAGILAVSATMDYHVNAVRDLITAVKREEGCREVKIMVGGAPFNLDRSLWKEVGADGYSSSAEEAVTVAKNLLGVG
ncbi:MAG: cobalamin-dependent protein [Bacillota bacterium]|nr:cobalamin-dependent protein [Bacillota bacterium]